MGQKGNFEMNNRLRTKLRSLHTPKNILRYFVYCYHQCGYWEDRLPNGDVVYCDENGMIVIPKK